MHGRLCALQVTDIDGLSQTIPVDDLLVFFGLSPKLGPITDWGLNIDVTNCIDSGNISLKLFCVDGNLFAINS